MAHDPVILDHGADESSNPDLAPVLGSEQDALTEILPRRHGSPEALLHLGRAVRAGQEEVVLAEDLVTRVAAQVKKSGIGVDDRVVDDLGVGHQHRHAGCLDRLHERAAPILDFADPAFGIVAP